MYIIDISLQDTKNKSKDKKMSEKTNLLLRGVPRRLLEGVHDVQMAIERNTRKRPSKPEVMFLLMEEGLRHQEQILSDSQVQYGKSN